MTAKAWSYCCVCTFASCVPYPKVPILLEWVRLQKKKKKFKQYYSMFMHLSIIPSLYLSIYLSKQSDYKMNRGIGTSF